MSQTAAQTAAYRAKRRAAGLCTYCAQPSAAGGVLCPQHTQANRLRRRQWRKAQKEARAAAAQAEYKSYLLDAKGRRMPLPKIVSVTSF